MCQCDTPPSNQTNDASEGNSEGPGFDTRVNFKNLDIPLWLKKQ